MNYPETMRFDQFPPILVIAALCAVGCASVPVSAPVVVSTASNEPSDALYSETAGYFETAGTYAAYSDAVSAAREGDLEGAILILENLSAFGDPASVDVHLTLSRYYRRSGDVRKALERARLAARLAPERAGARRMEAACLMDLDAYALAVDALVRLLELEPGDLPSRLKLARILTGLGRASEALLILDEGHRITPGNRSLTVAHVEALGAHGGAQSALDFVESLDGDDFVVRVLHADLLAFQGQ